MTLGCRIEEAQGARLPDLPFLGSFALCEDSEAKPQSVWLWRDVQGGCAPRKHGSFGRTELHTQLFCVHGQGPVGPRERLWPVLLWGIGLTDRGCHSGALLNSTFWNVDGASQGRRCLARAGGRPGFPSGEDARGWFMCHLAWQPG